MQIGLPRSCQRVTAGERLHAVAVAVVVDKFLIGEREGSAHHLHLHETVHRAGTS